MSFTQFPVDKVHGKELKCSEVLNKTKCKILMFDSKLKAAIKTLLILQAGHVTILFCSISHYN